MRWAGFIFRAVSRFQRHYDEFRVERTKGLLAACGERVMLSAQCVIWPESGLRLGNDVTIHSFTHIFAGAGVSIGDGTMISSNCAITTVGHPKNCSHRHDTHVSDDPNEILGRPVVIGRNVWIGAGAVILPGVTIGDHAIIGAGTVLTKSVPDRCVFVGNPGRLLQRLEIPED